jgi:hypothetical protein
MSADLNPSNATIATPVVYMANGKLSPELNRLLIIRGLCRAVLPAAVLWGIVDWYRIRPIYGLIFGALTLNYIITFALVWVSPG